jgi:hypothetical protein
MKRGIQQQQKEGRERKRKKSVRKNWKVVVIPFYGG